jgi:hypothetical protein
MAYSSEKSAPTREIAQGAVDIQSLLSVSPHPVLSTHLEDYRNTESPLRNINSNLLCKNNAIQIEIPDIGKHWMNQPAMKFLTLDVECLRKYMNIYYCNILNMILVS